MTVAKRNTPLISHREIARSILFRHNPTAGACWIWTGLVRAGSPRILSGHSARQEVYERIRGHRPGGVIKPWCGNRLCVNPRHMYGVLEEP